MKILFVSAFRSNEHFAYKQRLLNLKEGLQQLGISTEMLYLGDYFIKSRKLDAVPFIQALEMPLVMRKLEGYDAIHGGAYMACHVLGIMKNICKFTLIHDVHGCPEELLLKSGKFDLVNKFGFLKGRVFEEISNKNANFFVTCSKPLGDRLIEKGIAPTRIEVIRNGVDTELFKPREVSHTGNKFIATYAGAFQNWQGIENFAAAAKLIKDPSVKFRIIGFRKKDTMLKSKLNQILGEKAELLNSLNREELINELCTSDILIIPRNRNFVTQMAFPTKFAEYLAVGKPVIVTNVDETANFVRKFNCGFVCEPSAESIAKTIIKARKLPSSTLLAMGKNARRLAESQFDRRIIANQYAAFLRKILPNS